MAGVSSPLGSPVGGQTQIIGGKQYSQYTPEWYAAMDADKVHNATVGGTAAGAAGNAALTGLQGALTGITGSGSTGATGGVGTPGTSGSPLPTVPYGGGTAAPRTASGTAGAAPDISGAQAAAFARAKDTAGGLARGSVSSLNDEMAGRGVLNSGITNQGLVDRLSAATNTLGNVDAAQLGDAYTAASHQQDLENTDQNVQYQGGIVQRGQDQTAQTAANALAVQKQSALFSALKGLLGTTDSTGLY